MDVITHTLLAGIAMFACYLWGKHLTYTIIIEEVVDNTLVKLEDEGFIKIEIDEDGDKSLVPISRIEAK
tara:strand:+ start:634 stop:840 length:207 start_codon:yes stop_codon:yes gene_type:complete